MAEIGTYLEYLGEITAFIVLVFILYAFVTGQIVSRKTLDSHIQMVERILKEFFNPDDK